MDFHLPQRTKKPKLKKERIKKVKSPKVRPTTAPEPDTNVIIGRTETNEAVVVEVVDEEEYEANRFNAWSSRKRYS